MVGHEAVLQDLDLRMEERHGALTVQKQAAQLRGFHMGPGGVVIWDDKTAQQRLAGWDSQRDVVDADAFP